MDTKPVQLRLQAAGHYSGRIDGDFGPLSYGGCGFRGHRAHHSDLMARGLPN